MTSTAETATTRTGEPKIVKPAPKPKPKPKVKARSSVAKTIKELIRYEESMIKKICGEFPEGTGDPTFTAIQGIAYHLDRIARAKRVLAYLEGN